MKNMLTHIHSNKMKHMLYTLMLVCTSCMVTACGFQLRGSVTPALPQKNISFAVVDTTIHPKYKRILNDGITSELISLGANLNQKAQPNTGVLKVEVSNINLRKHRLVGTVTEVQLLLTADITMSSNTSNQRKRQLITQRSYQYNQNTVSSMDAEERRTIERMYQEMADKVSYQIALFESVQKP